MAKMDDLKGEIVAEVELKSGPDRFFKFWKSEAHKTPNHASTHIQGVRLHEGDWDTPGSIKIWDYTVDGKSEVFKEKIEVEEEKKLVKLTGLDGDVFKIYKVYIAKWHIIPKGDGYAAKITIEYEKLNPDVPTPQNYLDFLANFTKDIDSGLVAAA
ncbi:Polyketide cyclase/dehydrase and lipid transport superfamily protein [Euphorbia peplus]|nr:Polyketide cyclase/dehydrase and lipid transport superfamily protein [Euphorbia peplus]